MSPSTGVLLVPNICFLEETVCLYPPLDHGALASSGENRYLRHCTGNVLTAALRDTMGVARHSHLERQCWE
jgi:hypothetical protein